MSLMARKLELKTRKDWSDFQIFMRNQNFNGSIGVS